MPLSVLPFGVEREHADLAREEGGRYHAARRGKRQWGGVGDVLDAGPAAGPAVVAVAADTGRNAVASSADQVTTVILFALALWVMSKL
jgi:hypothetical protein